MASKTTIAWFVRLWGLIRSGIKGEYRGKIHCRGPHPLERGMYQQEASPMAKKLRVVGIDIAQQVFYLVGMDKHGTIQLRKRLARAQVMTFIAQLPPTLIAMEACGGAHYWARRLREHGHEVKLMAPQCVTPYR